MRDMIRLFFMATPVSLLLGIWWEGRRVEYFATAAVFLLLATFLAWVRGVALKKQLVDRPMKFTDDMVERAAGVIWASTALSRTPESLPDIDKNRPLSGEGARYRRTARAALEAALNPKER